MKIIKHPWSGRIMAGIGIVTVLSEIVLHHWSRVTGRELELNIWILSVGAAIGFAGFWIVDSKKTKEAAEVIADLVPKFGRRKTDAVAIPEATTVVVSKPATDEHKIPGETG